MFSGIKSKLYLGLGIFITFLLGMMKYLRYKNEKLEQELHDQKIKNKVDSKNSRIDTINKIIEQEYLKVQRAENKKESKDEDNNDTVIGINI